MMSSDRGFTADGEVKFFHYLPWSVPIERKGDDAYPGSEESPNDRVHDHAFSRCVHPVRAGEKSVPGNQSPRNYTSFNSENKRVHSSLSISLAVSYDSFGGTTLENPNDVKRGSGRT